MSNLDLLAMSVRNVWRLDKLELGCPGPKGRWWKLLCRFSECFNIFCGVDIDIVARYSGGVVIIMTW